MSHSRVAHSKTARARQQATRSPYRGRPLPSGGRYGAQGHRLGNQDFEQPHEETHGTSAASGAGVRTLERY